MTDTLIAAMIAAAASIVCQLIIHRAATKKADAERAARDQNVDDRLGRIEENQRQTKADNDARLSRIEEKLDTHNHYAEKLTAIETDIQWLKDAQAK